MIPFLNGSCPSTGFGLVLVTGGEHLRAIHPDLQDSAKAIVGATPHHFRPRYAGANLGHPSCSLGPCYDTGSCGTVPIQIDR
jgi:hypothetical protein